MTPRPFDHDAAQGGARGVAPAGRSRWAWLAGLLVAGGVGAAVLAGRGGAALVPLRAGWLFLSGLAAGGVAFAAAVRIARGRWAGAILPLAEAGARFFPVSLALLVLLLAAEAGAADAPARAAGPRAAALVASAALAYGLGARAVARGRGPARRARRAAAAYLAAFAVAAAAWALALGEDLVALPAFSVVPVAFAAASLFAGVAGAALAAAAREEAGADARQDLGRLLVGLAAVFGWLLWSLLLPTWYGHVPGEWALLRGRWDAAGGAPAGLVVAGGVALPVVLLFTHGAKRRRAVLGLAASGPLAATWAAAFLLAAPAGWPGDAVDAAVAAVLSAALAALFLLSISGALAPGAPRPPTPAVP